MSANKPRSTDHSPLPSDPEVRQIADRSSERVSRLLEQFSAEGLTPFEVFTTVVLATGVVGKALDMPLADLQEGIAAAYASVVQVGVHDVH